MNSTSAGTGSSLCMIETAPSASSGMLATRRIKSILHDLVEHRALGAYRTVAPGGRAGPRASETLAEWRIFLRFNGLLNYCSLLVFYKASDK